MRAGLSLLLIASLPGAAHASDVVVPPGGDIQAAIDAATDGDRVLVSAGTYFQRIDFHGKAIEVQGQSGAAATVLDATGLAGSVVSFISGEGRDSVLSGLTLRGGSGTVVPFSAPETAGGGILSLDSAPTVRDCIVADNKADRRGGGVFAQGTVSGLGPDFEACRIESNKVTTPGYPGGGLYLLSTSTILRDCVIANNGANGIAGGLGAIGGELVAERCHVTGNQARGSGGGLSLQNLGVLSIVDCVISGNEASSSSGSAYGGGLYVNVGNPVQAQLVNCVVSHNVASNAAGIYVVTFLEEPPPAPRATIDHCTVTRNTSIGGGGCGVSVSGKGVEVRNSIVWGNSGGLQVLSFGPVDFVFDSDVQFGVPGASNIDADPMLVDLDEGDVHLLHGSPCIDQASASASEPESDFEGDPRVSGTAADMGADEFHPHLYVTGQPAAGAPIELKLIGTPGGATMLFGGLALLAPPIQTQYGAFAVEPLFSFGMGVVPQSGLVLLPASIPPGTPPGIAIVLQAFTGAALTNVFPLVTE